MDLNQSTVSYALDKMRTVLGFDLFVKSGRGIIPSERALELTPRVYKILSELKGLAVNESYIPLDDPASVKIAISSPALLPDIKRIHSRVLSWAPKRKLELIRLAPKQKIVEILENGRAEIAIARSGVGYPTTLHHQQYRTDQLVVYYDSKHRNKPETIDEYCSAKHVVVNASIVSGCPINQTLSDNGLSRTISLVAPTTSMLGDLITGTDLIATMESNLAETTFGQLSCCPPPMRFLT